MIKRLPPKTTRMRVVLCGQCDAGRHDHCSKSPACECACKGVEVPPPQVTADELAHAIRVEALSPAQSPEPHVGKYVASTVPIPADDAINAQRIQHLTAPLPPDRNANFPPFINVVQRHGALYLVLTPTPTAEGTIYASYELKEVRELKTVTEIKETVLNLDDFITAPL